MISSAQWCGVRAWAAALRCTAAPRGRSARTGPPHTASLQALLHGSSAFQGPAGCFLSRAICGLPQALSTPHICTNRNNMLSSSPAAQSGQRSGFLKLEGRVSVFLRDGELEQMQFALCFQTGGSLVIPVSHGREAECSSSSRSRTGSPSVDCRVPYSRPQSDAESIPVLVRAEALNRSLRSGEHLGRVLVSTAAQLSGRAAVPVPVARGVQPCRGAALYLFCLYEYHSLIFLNRKLLCSWDI